MAVYTQVVASRLAKYRAQMERDGNDADLDTAMLKYVICQLVDASFAGGGGGGSTSAATIAQGINDAIDLDAIIARLQAIDNKTPSVGAALIAGSTPVNIASDQIVNVRDRSTTTPIAQAPIVLTAGATGQYTIPANARSVTICVTSGGLVYYTEDGTAPTASNCWFGGGTKEIWDYAVPAGATLRLLAVSAATISIQVRV